MKKQELAKKTKAELMEIAKEVGLVGRSGMKKEDLVLSLASLLKEGKPAVEKKKTELAHAIAEVGKTESWQEKVEDAKYFVGVAEKGVTAGEELPAGYADNRIVLMVRDPYWAYVYWDINSDRVEEAKRTLHSVFDRSRLILRVYDVTGIDFNGTNASSFFDIDVPNILGNWYVNLGKPNRSFCIDIGYRRPDGGIFTLSRSNRITSPRDTFSDVMDEEWGVMEGFDALYAWFGGVGVGGSAELAERITRGIEKGVSSGSVRGVGAEKLPRHN